MKVVRILSILGLLVIGLYGLGMTVCGGGAILDVLRDANLYQREPQVKVVLILEALFCIPIGIITIVMVWRAIADWLRSDDEPR